MNGLRKLQFMIKGYFNFTKRSEPLPPLEGTLEGQNFVITGANSGIGYAAAKEAAARKANVYLVCRDQQRGEAARKKIAE
jgi:dehydrogenase/reductase SDR family protein 12